MLSILTALLSLVVLAGGVVALAAIVYPFRPFRSRKRALLTALISPFVFVGLVVLGLPDMTTPTQGNRVDGAISAGRPSGTPGTRTSDTRTSSTGAPAPERPAPGALIVIEDAIDHREFKAAAIALEALGPGPISLGNAAADLEARTLAQVTPIPASNHAANLSGYELLALIAPDNPAYAAKVAEYRGLIERERQSAVARLNRSEDRIEGITWYKHPNQPRYLNSRSTTYLYIGRRGETGRPWLRMKVTYAARDWLFVSNVIAWADGERMTFVRGGFERDHDTTIWESVDVENRTWPRSPR